MNNLQERQISLSFAQLAAYVLALAGVALIGLNFVASSTNDHYGFASIPAFAMSMLLSIRVYFCRMARLVKETQAQVIETRELVDKAFAFGREVGREEAGGGDVRSLR